MSVPPDGASSRIGPVSGTSSRAGPISGPISLPDHEPLPDEGAGLPRFDILVVGSGFAGSLAAMALDHHGMRVCVVEAGRHPRFAIGESSTPAADMILRSLAADHGMPWLAPFSRYGSWQTRHPDVGCGLKRGFSYFFHEPGRSFSESAEHERSLMVAASTSDENSDTQWLRADFDAFLVDRLREAGMAYHDGSRVMACERGPHGTWRITIHGAAELEVEARYIIDATGSSRFAEEMFGARSTTSGFATRSSAVYSHFDGAGYWRDHLEARGCPLADHPYDPDHSALHHVIEEGWLWMLRFRSGLLSAGLVLDGHDLRGRPFDPDSGADPEAGLEPGSRRPPAFAEVIGRYPSIEALFRSARPSPTPGRVLSSGRLQRRLEPACGEGWLALGHAAGFVDPLHSTGIAHSLVSVERVAALAAAGGLAGLEVGAPELAADFRLELGLIDRLVAAAYDSRAHPELFHACTMLYFVCTIAWEQARLRGERPAHFLMAGDDELRELVEWAGDAARAWRLDGSDPVRGKELVTEIRDRITPWNPVGLLDPAKRRMYRHTAVRL